MFINEPDSDCKLQKRAERVKMATEITREQWVQETERLCPSDRAFEAYVELEQTIVNETDLECKYECVSRGNSDYATFYAGIGKCDVAQMYKGQCQLNWRWKGKYTGMSPEGVEMLQKTFEEFRITLDGKEGKGWEAVKVLRLGEENVQTAVKKLAGELCTIISDQIEVKG